MKKRYAILLILLLWMPLLHGAWNKDKPAATTGLNVSNPLILANFSALETAIGANHEFSTGGTNSGKHTGIVLEEQSSVTTSANEMGFYCKDLGAAPGIYVRPQSSGTAIQWSDITGKIVNAAMADDSIDSAQYVDASIDLAHLSVNSIDSDQYVDNSIDPAHLVDDFTFDTFPLSPSSAPDADYELSNKKYVNDQITANVAVAGNRVSGWVNFAGADGSVNDSFNVSGSVTRNSTGNYTITWDTNFANANYVISIVVPETAGSITVGNVVSLSAGSCNITTRNFSAVKDPTIVLVMAIGDQ